MPAPSRPLRRRPGLGLLAAIVIAGVGWAAHWTDIEHPRVYSDSYEYLRIAARMIGDPHPDASALRVYCNESGPVWSDHHRRCVSDIAAIERGFGARYRAIFTARVGFPLILAGPMAVFGDSGVAVAVAALFIGTAAVLFGAIRLGGGSRGNALTAVALYGILPSGTFASMVLSEGALMLGACLAVLGITLVLRSGAGRGSDEGEGEREPNPSRHIRGIAVLTAGLVLAWSARGSVGTCLAVALALGVLLVAGPTASRRQRTTIAAVCGATAVVVTAVGALLHQPSITENLQLQATGRFTRPDVADPWRYLAHTDLRMIRTFVSQSSEHGYAIAIATLGLAALVGTLRRRAWPWLAVAAVALVSVIAYPDPSAAYRFLCTLWIPVAVGIGAAVDVLRGAQTSPAAPTSPGADAPGARHRPNGVPKADEHVGQAVSPH